MPGNEDVQLSRLMSLVLRHRPAQFGVELDAAGWADLDAFLAALAPTHRCDRDDVLRVVRTSDKKRYEVSSDGCRIRAVQGHTVTVELGHPEAAPPERLFHGTVARYLPSILERGLIAGRRHDVHLSATLETARAVGSRRGDPVVLAVESGAMARAGHVFRRAPNGVWLTAEVPAKFIAILDEAEGREG